MRRLTSCFVFVTFIFLAFAGLAQDSSSLAAATCNFDADKQLMAEYQPVSVNPKKPLFGHEIPAGKVWAPGGKPITLFTNTPVEIGGRQLAPGAYTMFVIPTAKQWMLIVSKSTDMSGKYDETMDLVRVPMESGELPSPEQTFKVSFEHVAQDQCSLRLDIATMANGALFKEK